MDFDAVAEAVADGRSRTVDATLLAPRGSLVRIATGREPADTSLLTAYGAAADLLSVRRHRGCRRQLPGEDVTGLVSIT